MPKIPNNKDCTSLKLLDRIIQILRHEAEHIKSVQGAPKHYYLDRLCAASALNAWSLKKLQYWPIPKVILIGIYLLKLSDLKLPKAAEEIVSMHLRDALFEC